MLKTSVQEKIFRTSKEKKIHIIYRETKNIDHQFLTRDKAGKWNIFNVMKGKKKKKGQPLFMQRQYLSKMKARVPVVAGRNESKETESD